MRNSIVFLVFFISFLGLSASAQVISDDNSTPKLSGVERKMVEIELDVQLKTYRKILMSLYETEIDWAVIQLDDTASKEEVRTLQTRIDLLRNLQETAALRALKFEQQLQRSPE